VELSEVGREQAELTGQRLKNYEIDAVYSSNLIRAVETADIINKYLDKPRFYDDRLREAEFGDLTGLENSVLKERYKEFLAKRATMTQDIAYPGGENSQMVFERAFAAIEDIIEKDFENVCIVTHGGVIRALLTGIVGAAPAKWLTYGRQLENCSISEIMYDRQMKTYHIERFNDYAHFENEDRLLRKHFGTGFFKSENEPKK
jgi:probable phosphoglycerate mutase